MKNTDNKVYKPNYIFKLYDPKTLYSKQLKELGGNPDEYTHSTHLAEQLQQYVPSLQVNNSNVGLVLTFKENIGDVLLDACKENADDIAVKFLQLTNYMHKEVLMEQYLCIV